MLFVDLGPNDAFFIIVHCSTYIYYSIPKKIHVKTCSSRFLTTNDKWLQKPHLSTNHDLCGLNRQFWFLKKTSGLNRQLWLVERNLRLLFNQFLHCKLTVKLHWTALNPILMVNFWLTVFLDTLQTSPKQTVTSELCQPKGKLHDTPWNPIKTCWIPYVFDGKKTMKKHHVCWSTAPHIAYTVLAMAISYNWLFLWDYTFYKWGCKYL